MEIYKSFGDDNSTVFLLLLEMDSSRIEDCFAFETYPADALALPILSVTTIEAFYKQHADPLTALVLFG